MARFIGLITLTIIIFSCKQEKEVIIDTKKMYCETLSRAIDSLFNESEIIVPLGYSMDVNVMKMAIDGLGNSRNVLHSSNQKKQLLLQKFEKNICPIDSNLAYNIIGDKFNLIKNAEPNQIKGLIEITNFQYDEKTNFGLYSFSFFLGKKGNYGYLLSFNKNKETKSYQLLKVQKIWEKVSPEIKFLDEPI